jgi:small-conductance mechanosensitive channel
MLAVDVPIPLVSATVGQFLRDNPWLGAIAAIAAAIAVATIVDRAILHRGQKLAAAVMRDEMTAAVDTRLRFLRRLTTLVIVMIGVMTAIAQFNGLNRIATTVLASSALFAAVIGFAARQTLANLIAGVMLTIAQPLRIGDVVTVEDQSGMVEDVRLNYTVVRAAEGHRIFIPNERLAGGVLRNDSIVDPLVAVEVELALPLELDADRVLAALAGLDGAPSVSVAEIAFEGVRYMITRGSAAPRDRPRQAAALRADALRALREAGLLAGAPASAG